MRLSMWKLLSSLAIPGVLIAATSLHAEAPAAMPAYAEQPSVDCGDNSCKRGGVIGGAEVLFLKPYNSEGIAPIFDALVDIANSPIVTGIVGAPLNINEPGFDLEGSYRLWLGWQSASGLGFRVTYFDWDNNANANTSLDAIFGEPVAVDLNYRLEGRTLDLEVIDTFRPSDNYLLTLSAGFRYVEYIEENRLGISVPDSGFVAPELLTTGYNSRDYGLVFGADLTRRVGDRLALFIGTRLSALYGDQDEIFRVSIPGGFFGIDTLDLTEQEQDNVKFIFEGRVGGQYTRELSSGALAFFRVAAEAQYWDKFTGTPLPIVGNSQGAFGLLGLGISVGISR